MGNKIKLLMKSLADISSEYEKVSFSSSLSAEDMVLSHMIATHKFPIEVFTLDTGRLHEETYQLMQKVQDKYDNQLKIYFPDANDLEEYINHRGTNAFYQSVDFRKTCCQIRKVRPLKRALQGQQIWITGLRKQQSVTREKIETLSWDESFKLYKFNPLLDWTYDDVWQYIKENEVPYNDLHDEGYPSIGCSPCTRAISRGEDERAGRWWWESPETKECGLHVAANKEKLTPGKIVA